MFNASEDNTQNIKLDNIEDYTNLENQLNNKKEQPKHNGSDCSHLVHPKRLVNMNGVNICRSESASTDGKRRQLSSKDVQKTSKSQKAFVS